MMSLFQDLKPGALILTISLTVVCCALSIVATEAMENRKPAQIEHPFHKVSNVHHSTSPSYILSRSFHHSIGDFVWEDANMNGIQDPGEPGISDVTVNLYDDQNKDGQPDQNQPIATTISSGTSGQIGYYQIDQISTGSYVVEFVPPANFSPTSQNQGTNDLMDSDIDGSGWTQTIELGYTDCQKVEDQGLLTNGIIGETEYIISYDEEGEPYSVSFYGGNILDVTVKGGPDTAFYPNGPFIDLKAPVNPNNGKHYAISHFILCYELSNLSAVDAGFYRTSSVEGMVWFDYNENGQYNDNKEYQLAEWTVTLLNSNDVPLSSVKTDALGSYSFSQLDPGSYTLVVSVENGYEETYDIDGTSTPSQAQIILTYNEYKTDVDFGYVGKGAIGGYSWHDENQNALKDSFESGFSGYQTVVVNTNGLFSDTMVTDQTGSYAFYKLPPGTFLVYTTEPQEFVPFTDEDGTSTPNEIQVNLDPLEFHMSAIYGYIEQGAALPVSWISFDAHLLDNGQVELEWVTADEIDCKSFEIERSRDGEQWHIIGERTAEGAAEQLSTYIFLDEHPLCRTAYYRIRQTDSDNDRETSGLRQIHRECGSDLSLYPNPARQTIYLALNGQDYPENMSIYTSNGKIVRSIQTDETPETNTLAIDINALPTGVYFLKYSDPLSKRVQTHPFYILH